MNLRDQIGAERLPPFRASMQPAGLIRWLLVSQCALAEAVGLELTLRDLGAPTDEGDVQESSEPYFGAGVGGRPQSAQVAQQQQQQYQAPPSPRASDRAPFGTDEQQQLGSPSPRYAAYGAPPPSSGGGGGNFSADRLAHEASMAGALAARARNQGSLVLGGDPGESPRQHARPPPSRGGLPWEMGNAAPPPPPSSGGYYDARPDTAASQGSQAMMEAARIRQKMNQGSGIFG